MTKLLRELVILAASGFTVIALLVLVIWGVSAVFFSNDPQRVEEVQTGRATATPSTTARAGGGDDRASTPTPIIATPTSTPLPAPTQAPAAPPPLAPAAPQPPASTTAAANFSGRWRIVDTVTAGRGMGETYSFDVALSQSGNQLSGGNSGLVMSGTVNGQTAQVSYEQVNLGYFGTFSWTMGPDGNAFGSFTNSSPNSGASELIRLP